MFLALATREHSCLITRGKTCVSARATCTSIGIFYTCTEFVKTASRYKRFHDWLKSQSGVESYKCRTEFKSRTVEDNSSTTHVKISPLVASLQTSRQQVVFARLVTSCQQVWNKLLTTCNNLVDIVILVTRLFQQGCYSHDITILLQPCVVNLVTSLLYHDCIRLVRITL